jgi:hypothetical protein
VAPRGQISVPTPFPQSSNWHHCSFFLGDLLMLPYGLHHSWFWFSLLLAGLQLFWIGLCCFLAGGLLFLAILMSCLSLNIPSIIFFSSPW